MISFTGGFSLQSPEMESSFIFVSPAKGDKSRILEGRGRLSFSKEVRPDRGDKSEISSFPSKSRLFKFVIWARFTKSPSVNPFPDKSSSVSAVLYSSPAMVTLGASSTALSPAAPPPSA